MATVERGPGLPRDLRQNAPGSFGAALLGRLAVDRRAQGQMHGARMLLDAFEKCLSASVVGCAGVITDAKDENAFRFYKKHGFHPLQPTGVPESWPSRMFIPLKTVAEAVRAAST
ncbi:GNAT family N-acetyltransferase [Corallococcus macrosporus]|uniref:GNAT family N-acetyltransferase n=1 Tax=Corallococcus macrosporus TaxID=35 RepID=UPI003B831CA4